MSKNDLNLGFRRKRQDTKKDLLPKVLEYVEGDKEPSQVEPAPVIEQPKKPRSSALRKASRGERISIYLTSELEEYLRMEAARGKRSMSDLVSEALEMHRNAKE